MHEPVSCFMELSHLRRDASISQQMLQATDEWALQFCVCHRHHDQRDIWTTLALSPTRVQYDIVGSAKPGALVALGNRPLTDHPMDKTPTACDEKMAPHDTRCHEGQDRPLSGRHSWWDESPSNGILRQQAEEGSTAKHAPFGTLVAGVTFGTLRPRRPKPW